MFTTKDHGEEFSGKIEPAVESGKAEMSGMSRLSFPMVSVSKRKGRKRWEKRKNEETRRAKREEGGVWKKKKARVIATGWKTDRGSREERVAFALEIGRSWRWSQPVWRTARHPVPGRASAFPTITVSTNECNAVSQPLSPSLIYFDPCRCCPRAYIWIS